MYVCTCNGVRAREVDAAIQCGARTAKAVLAHQGCKPECCRCLKEITDQIKAAKTPHQHFAHVAAE